MSRMEFGEFQINSNMLSTHDRFLAAIVQSAHDAIISVDPSGMVLSWNRGAEDIFGFSEAEMIGLPHDRIIPPAVRHGQRLAVSRIFSGERLAPFPSLRIDESGQSMAVLVTLSPVLDEDGMIYAASAIIRRAPSTLFRSAPSAAARANEPLRPEEMDNVAAARARSRRNILVVDDEALNGLGLAAMLETVGHDVIGPAGTISAALSLIDRHGCGLVILAATLQSGETCAPLARRLKRDGIPYFVTCGDLAAHQVDLFSDAPRFAKPVRTAPLLAAVQEVMRQVEV